MRSGDGSWTGLCSGRPQIGGRALLVWLMAGALASAQTVPKSVAKKAEAHRQNEMTLAGLRPGRDTAARAVSLHGPPNEKAQEQGSQMGWRATCQTQLLTLDLDGGGRIQVVRTMEVDWSQDDCRSKSPGPWKTGRGLRVGDPTTKVTERYGEPESKSPSTRDGQPLELWYYAFDWAGPDVPQVMEVLCTRERDGRGGRVIEITLAAPSL